MAMGHLVNCPARRIGQHLWWFYKRSGLFLTPQDHNNANGVVNAASSALTREAILVYIHAYIVVLLALVYQSPSLPNAVP